MKDTARFRREGFSLIPVGQSALETLRGIGDGASIFVELWKPRNMKQHRKYFALLNNVVKATGRWASVEDLGFDIMLELKRGTFYAARNGSTQFRADSRAVASMPKAEFERLYDDTMALLTDWFGCDPEMLLEEAA
ncbi:MAG TPA: DUF1367 family protein [Woeseiaceae bacterium]